MDAARVGDMTDHNGTVTGPGVATVLIEKKPAAVVGDMHICVQAPPPVHAPSPFLQGSSKVFINGKAALRAGDACIGCGAVIKSRGGKVKFG